MIYGRMAALATLGLLSDMVFQARNYLLLLCFAFLACIGYLLQIVFTLADYSIPDNEFF